MKHRLPILALLAVLLAFASQLAFGNIRPVPINAIAEGISPAYDNNLSLMGDSRRVFGYNAMGWMVEAQNMALTHPLKLSFDYYPDGRRARKIVCEQDGAGWKTNAVHEFYYDGWNLISETIADWTTSPVKRITCSYTWGLDLAGQRDGRLGQESGGIGGLLAITEVNGAATNVYFPVADHHGTILKLIDGQTGAVVGEYDYDPYGVLLSKTGPKADLCPFRFTSKYYDPEIGLYYFGYRYYDPSTTKWLTLDPLGEEGGINLTAYCLNDPINKTDPMGLAPDTLIGGEFDITTGTWSDKTYHDDVDFTDPSLMFPDVPNMLTPSFVVAVGANATWSGLIRKAYDLRDARISSRAEEMVRRGVMTEKGAMVWRVEQRNELIRLLRKTDNAVGREYANLIKPLDRLATPKGLLARKLPMEIIRTRPNVGVDKIGRNLRIAGPTLMLLGVAIDVVDVATTPEEERLRKIYGIGGGYAGAASFAYAGGRMGAYVGKFVPHPLGPVVGGGLGLIGGGILGGAIGEQAGDNVYDAFVDE